MRIREEEMKTEIEEIFREAQDLIRHFPRRSRLPSLDYCDNLQEREDVILTKFLATECLMAAGMELLALNLYRRYRQRCNDSAVSPERREDFERRLSARGFERRRNGAYGSYVWYGIGLPGDTDDPDEDWDDADEDWSELT